MQEGREACKVGSSYKLCFGADQSPEQPKGEQSTRIISLNSPIFMPQQLELKVV